MYDKEKYERNKDKILPKVREHYYEHREEILKRRQGRYTCECGSNLLKIHKARHEKTSKHQDFIVRTTYLYACFKFYTKTQS